MTALPWIPIACLAAAAPAAFASPASIVRLALPGEASLLQPFAVPTEPGNSVEIEFPLPVVDWEGRGFTPDTGAYAGDFIILAERGSRRIFVTPVIETAHRVLHVVLAEAAGRTRSLPIEFIPAPPSVAWRKVVFTLAEPGPARKTAYRLMDRPPEDPVAEASPATEIGLLRTLRLMAEAPADDLQAIAASNPSLSLAAFGAEGRSFGSFSLACLFAIRDSASGSLGLCAAVSNLTARRLLFDPLSWKVRVGDHVYPANTVDFCSEVEPGSTARAFLVIARGPDGNPTRLLADNAFLPSVALVAAVSAKPVRRMRLGGFDPR
jgi:hypothetical protein